MEQNKVSQKKKKNFFTKYQIRILTQDFHHVSVFQLSKLDVYAALFSVTILVAAATIFILTYTSLGDMLPGWASQETKQLSLKNSLEITKLKDRLREKEQYANNLRLVLQGKDPVILKGQVDSLQLANISTARSKSDSIFRNAVEMSENYKLKETNSKDEDVNFLYMYTPMKGDVVSKIDPQKNRNWVEIKYYHKQMLYAPFDGYLKSSKQLSNGNFVIRIANGQGLEATFSNVPKVLKDDKQKIFSGEIIGLLAPKFTEQHDIIYFSLKNQEEILDPLNNVDF